MLPDLYPQDHEFTFGKAETLREGKDATIIATGLMVHNALKAAELLAAEGIDVTVLDMHTIKPIDAVAVLKAAAMGPVITAEEHSVIGGLGSAVCETLSEKMPTPVTRVGMEDKFGSSGPAVQLLEYYGQSAKTIVEKAKLAVSRK